jgi:hypothetical protein
MYKTKEVSNLMTLEEKKLTQLWLDKVSTQHPEISEDEKRIIVIWLVGHEFQQKEIANQGVEYLWNILHQRYLGVSPSYAYRNLITRLGSAVIRRNHMKKGIVLQKGLQRTMLNILQEVLEELLQTDSYIQKEMAEIAKLTSNRQLQNALLFTTAEEYCLRPVYNQPLLAYAFIEALQCRLEATV